MSSGSSEEKTRDPRVDSLLDALEKGATLEAAASAIGITSRQVRKWRAADPELEAAVREAMSDADDQVEAVTFKNCIDADASHNVLRMFWLKSRRPDVYKDRVEQQHGGDITFRYVNDWRSDGPRDPAPLPAPGPAAGAARGAAVQLACGGEKVEEDDAGDGPVG